MQNPDNPTDAEGRPAPPPQDGQTQKGAEDAVKDLKASGKEKVDHYRSDAADKVDSLADSARAAADKLEGGGMEEQFSRQITQLAEGMGKLSAALRDKSGDEILRDVQRVAREHPALFLAGSVALGLGAARFARASSQSDASGHADKAEKTDGKSSKGGAGENASKPGPEGSARVGGERPNAGLPAASTSTATSPSSDRPEKNL